MWLDHITNAESSSNSMLAKAKQKYNYTLSQGVQIPLPTVEYAINSILSKQMQLQSGQHVTDVTTGCVGLTEDPDNFECI